MSPSVSMPTVGANEELWLRFYEWYESGSGTSGAVQVSEWTGSGWGAWTTLGTAAQDGASSPGWSLAGVDLTAYAGKQVRVALSHQADFFTAEGWYVDDLEIVRETPAWSGAEGFEGGWNGWHSDQGVWQVGVPTAGPSGSHGGANCAGTILSGDYGRYTDSRLISPTVHLPGVSGDQRDWLQFYQWYDYNSGSLGTVQISERTGGGWGGWTTLAMVAQSGAGSQCWSLSAVDLTAYAGKDVRIAFSHQADFFTDKGWYVDDVQVVQSTPSWTSTETFEGGLNGWYSDQGVWELGYPTAGPKSPYAGTNCVGTILNANYNAYTDSRLISPSIALPSLAAGEEVWLRFYQWYKYNSGSSGVVQISAWNGASWGAWTSLAVAAQDNAGSQGWSSTGVDLTAYAGQTVRVAFYHQADFFTDAGWYIDNVAIVKSTPRWTGVEGFEGGWGGWSSDRGVWQVGAPTAGPAHAHSGSNCAGTLLAGDYDRYTDSRLVSPTVALPALTGDEELWLRFYEWYAYNTDSLGTVQIQAWTGSGWGAWTTLATVAQNGAGSQAWSYTGVDLTAYAGEKVRIAFDHQADFFTAKGWYIDDVALVQSVPAWSGVEGFEGGWNGWCSDQGEWEVGAPVSSPAAARRGANCAGTVLAGNFDAYTDSRLVSPTAALPTLAGDEGLELRFYQWFAYGWDALGTVEISQWTGGSWGPWTTLATPAPTSTSSGSWSPVAVDLASYAGQKVRIAFHHQAGFFTARGWYLDDVAIVPIRPEIEVSVGSTPVADGQVAPVSFGNPLRATLAPQLTFTVSNAGTATLSLGTLALDGNTGFQIVQPPAATVLPGASTTFILRMSTDTGGAKSATVRIPTNDRDENPFDFPVAGLVADLTVPDLVIAAADSKIVNTWTDQTVAVPVEVRNAGNTLAAGPFRVALYLSGDDVVDASDTVVGYYDLASLGLGDPAGRHRESISFAAPSQQGTYYLRALADSGGAVAEFDESNNWGQPITLKVATAPVTHVLSVGAKWTIGTVWRCDVEAQRVANAFGQYASVTQAQVLTLDANRDDNTQRLVDAVNAMKADVSPGDTFVFYINTHGSWAEYGDEVPVYAQYNPSDLSARWRTTGDEYLCLSQAPYDWISDDEFRQLFTDPAWQGVNKLFIVDSCFSGGFWGSTLRGDTGDLATLDRTALIAASTENNFAWGAWDNAAGGAVGLLGKALVSTLGDLRNQSAVTFQQLFDRINLNGSVYRGTNGRVLSFMDGNDAIEASSQFDASNTASDLFQLTLGSAQNNPGRHQLTPGPGTSSWTFPDADGDQVTVTLGGRVGSAEIIRLVADGQRGDIAEIKLTGTDPTSSLTLTARATAPGHTAHTTVGRIAISGSLGRLSAPAADLAGDLAADGTIGSLSLDGVTGSQSTISFGGVGSAASLTLGRVTNLTISTPGTPIKSLSATDWLDPDSTADTITAPWIGTLKATGRKSNLGLGVPGDFQAGLVLSGVGSPGQSLSAATIAGLLGEADWTITGNVGTISAAAADSWNLTLHSALKSLTLGEADDVAIDVAGAIASVTVADWDGGSLNAYSLGSLKANGNPRAGIAGNFNADLTLTGQGVAFGKATLGSAAIAGQAAAGTWDVTGDSGAVKVGSATQAWTARVTGNVASLASTGTLSGTWTARSVKTVSSGGNIEHLALTLTQTPDLRLLALGSLSAKGLIDGCRIASAGNIGNVTAVEMRNTSLFAGVTATRDTNAADQVLDLPAPAADLATPGASIASVRLTGVKIGTTPVDSYINSNIAAGLLKSVTLPKIQKTHGSPFGLACHQILSFTYEGRLVKPLAAFQDGDFELRIG